MNDTNKSEKTKQGSVLKGFLEFFYGNVVVLLLGFISLPLTTRILSTDEYGRNSLFTSAVSIIYIFAILGLDQSYIRFYYGENVDKRKLFKQCLCPPLLLIVILSAVYFAFSAFFNNFLFGKGGFDVTLLVVAYTITSVFERFLFLNIRMDQRGKLYSNLNILSKILNISVLLICAYLLGDDFRVGLYAQTLPLVLVTTGLIVAYIVAGVNHKSVTHTLTSRELLTYGIPFVPMLLMEWLLSSMDKWSIRFFNDFSETGVYSSAMQIMTILLTLKITYVAFWSPIAMEKYENESEEVVKPFFADIFQKVQFLCMLAAFMLTCFRGIIVLILGADYRAANKIIPFLSLMPVLSVLFEMTGQGIKFKKKPKYFNYASLVAIVCNLLGNTLLVPRFCGIGAAIATAVTYIVYFAIGTYFAQKCYPVKYEYKNFVISLALYIGYASFATVTSREWLNVVIGIVLIVVIMILNKKVVKSLFEYCVAFIKDIIKKEKSDESL